MFDRIAASLQDLLFPRLCFACEEKIRTGFLCPPCTNKIKFLRPPVCRLCSSVISNNTSGLCRSCRSRPAPYERLVSVAGYQEPLISLIHTFKYQHCDYLHYFLTNIMQEHLERIGMHAYGYDYVTAVPMHPEKLKSRGYNQAALLAASLAKYFTIPFKNDIIYERKPKASQTTLTKLKRQENVQGLFSASEAARGARIILVDDIVTTGATIRECATALKIRGALAITAITLAKTHVS
ncbi:MAG: double zinc ribbon domain-containing protein [Candidatus Omnitrophota bacterium]